MDVSSGASRLRHVKVGLSAHCAWLAEDSTMIGLHDCHSQANGRVQIFI
jgi:hypothetical protein